MPSFVTHLEAAIDGTIFPARTVQSTHAGRPLWVRYDLAGVGRAVARDDLRDRPQTMWRFQELLPIERDSDIVSLGESCTPLLECPRLAAHLGLARLLVKDEAGMPTGSFKARGMAAAVSMAKGFGISHIAVPTAGNAGGALAAYCARAGIACTVFMPEDTPLVNQAECALFGARVFLVNGLINDCGAIVRDGVERFGWFDFSTLKEPYRLEGKKTMGLELAEQLGWTLPDVILYPTGGGTGLIGMWKGFEELDHLGWIPRGERPRMFSCQTDGCAPIATAFDRGERFAHAPERPFTQASGLRVPKPVGDFMILDAVRASGGRAVAVSEARLSEWMRLVTRLEGISLCPESAACVGVLQEGLANGTIARDETVVLFNTGAAQKYVEFIRPGPLPRLDVGAVDWSQIAPGRV